MIDKPLAGRVDAAQLHWFRDVERMSIEREVDEARLRGRPELVLLDMIEIVLNKRKVRNLNIQHYCVIMYNILQIINVINLAYKKFVFTEVPGDWTEYKYYRNLVLKETPVLRKRYYKEQIDNLKQFSIFKD